MDAELEQQLRALGRLLCAKRREEPYASIGRALKMLATLYENLDYDFSTNGEGRVLETLARFEPRVVLDVGANVGAWARLAVSRLEHAVVHAFEIAPSIFAELSANCAGEPRIIPNNLGFDEKPGEVALNLVGGGHHENSSVYPRDRRWAVVEAVVPCKVSTLDAYLTEKNIETVDFLKIDTEGMDHRVLRGAELALRRRAITAIQFEYGLVAVETRFLLKDFFEMLGGYGYAVGKIYPSYVDFRRYHRSMEDFVGPNFLAVRSDRTDMVSAYAGR